MFNFHKLLQSQYLFYVNPIMLTRSDMLFLVLGGLALVLAVVMKFAAVTAPSSVDRKYRDRLFNLFLTFGLWEVIWFGCRWENINFFGSHFVALLGLLIAVVWFVFIAAALIKKYRSEKQQWEKDQVKLRYLPR